MLASATAGLTATFPALSIASESNESVCPGEAVEVATLPLTGDWPRVVAEPTKVSVDVTIPEGKTVSLGMATLAVDTVHLVVHHGVGRGHE